MPERILGTPGGPAQRVVKRNAARPAAEKPDYKGDVEIREKLRQNLFSKDGEEILVVVLEQAKKYRLVTFASGTAPDVRLAAIGRVTVYRELVEAIFTKADLPIPEELMKVLT